MAARYEYIQYNNEEIRIVMAGKPGSGKTATANVILGKEIFKSKYTSVTWTEPSGKASFELDGQKVSVINVQDLFNKGVDQQTAMRNISQCLGYASPGPHVFLVVTRLGRYSKKDVKAVQRIQEIFGEEVDKYCMVLFTQGDLLRGRTIEEFLGKSKELQELVAKCNGQYHVFDNELKDRSQVSELLRKIRNITEKNGGRHYTNVMFQEKEKALEDKKTRILKEKEERIQKKQEALERELEEEYEQRIREAKDDKNKVKELRAELEKEKERRRAELFKQYEVKARREAEERSLKSVVMEAAMVGAKAGVKSGCSPS